MGYNIGMKIAIFTDLYRPWTSGGIVSSIVAQKAELEKLGHEVTVFCPGENAREKNVVTVPTHKRLKINGAPIAMRPSVIEEFILEKFPDFGKFDIVHVHYEASCSIAGVCLAQKFEIPLVQTMHGREDMAITVNVPHPWKYLVASVLNFAHGRCLTHTLRVKKDRFQAPTRTRAKMWELMVNQAEAADIVLTPSAHFMYKLEHYGVSKPMQVVPNAVSEDLFEAEVPVRKYEDGDVLKMIWNCRVSKEKRIMPLLAALREMKRPYILYVYGDGNMLKRAERYAKRYGLKVKFYGYQKREKILRRMKEAHLGVVASYNFDTQGMILIEAEAAGLPVFFCDPDMAEVVPAESYVLAGAPDAVSMAIALDGFAPERIEKMSKKMIKVRKEVLQSVQTKKLLAVYREAARKKCGDS